MCPTDEPFLSTTGCIACFLPSYFNATTRQCLTCQPGYEFDPLMRTCSKVDCGSDKIFI
jgi:hypothetical protein